MFRLEGKVALITGASRGIGAAIAIGMAEAGAKTVLVSRGAPRSEVVAALDAAGQPYVHHTANLRHMESIGPTIEAALARFGRIDILVNNAGTVGRVPFLEHTEAMWDEVLEVDLKIPFFLAQACARQMIRQGGGGKIINICSVLSYQGGIKISSYAAAKHGLAGATRAMANELAAQGINVNGIAPGYIRTDINASLREDPSRDAAIRARIPQGDWGKPSDIAGAAVFLASAASDYMHGHILTVDGGWMSR